MPHNEKLKKVRKSFQKAMGTDKKEETEESFLERMKRRFRERRKKMMPKGDLKRGRPTYKKKD